jgi:hypothetical protein
VKVSLDSRYEAAYPEAVFEDVLAFYEGRERPEGVLARYGADAVLVPPGHAALRGRLTWPRVYDDGSFAIFAHPGLSLVPASAVVAAHDRFP